MTNQGEYNRDLWRWFLKRAQQHNVYGGFSPIEPKIVNHLRDSWCGIDYENSAVPDFGNVSKFDGTDNDDISVDAITAEDWTCNCGKYGARSGKASKVVTLAIPGPYSLGKVIYEVIEESQS